MAQWLAGLSPFTLSDIGNPVLTACALAAGVQLAGWEAVVHSVKMLVWNMTLSCSLLDKIETLCYQQHLGWLKVS